MKVLFILIEFPKLSETFILNQIIGLRKHGINVNILAIKNPNENIYHNSIKEENLLESVFYVDPRQNNMLGLYHRFKLTFNSLIKNFSQYWEPIKLKSLRDIFFVNALNSFNKKFDIIHAHFGEIGLYGAKLKRWKIFSGKLITTFYGYDLSSYLADKGERVYDPLFIQGDLFLPISDYFNDRLLILGCPQKKILIHRLGIDIKEFDFRPRIISDKIKLLTVGRLVDKKGIGYSINAIKHIIHNRKDINIEYNVIGDGPNKKRYLEIIEKENLKDKINLLGSKTHDEVKNFMYDSHIYIQPSITALNGDKEGTPVSLMEAMSSGMPVISTFHSGIPELVENGVSGYLVEEKNHEMLMDKILYLINNKNLWPELIKNARAKIENDYNSSIQDRRLIEIYNNILN